MIALHGTWQATPADDESRRAALDLGGRGPGWEDVSVPGHWRDVAAFADHDGPLLYRRTIEVDRAAADDDRWWLVVDGALAQAEVWLDGTYLGPTEGWFSSRSFDITDAHRRPGPHVITIEVACPRGGDDAARSALLGAFTDSQLIDPTWNPGGLWRAPRLERTGPVRLDRLRMLCLSVDEERAVLGLRAALTSDEPAVVGLQTLVDPAGEVTGRGSAAATTVERQLASGVNHVDWRVVVEDPARWWPRAMGDQPLYDVRVETWVDGEPSHARKRRTGLREVTLDDWVLSVNGERIFAKGASQAPLRRSLAEITPADVERDLGLAVDAGLDLLRVRGHVAPPELYRTADRLGLLVWQDLPLAGPVPASAGRSAARQATDLVDLLGHHPSVALWCGHDEPTRHATSTEVLADPRARRRRQRRRALVDQLPSWRRSVVDVRVARALRAADRSRPVVAASGVAPHLPALDGSDSHLWLGWRRGDERDLSRLAARLPRWVRFVGDFGSQSVPDAADFVDPARWPALDWEDLSRHHGLRRPLLDARVPAAGTFEDWRQATQRDQADLIRRTIAQLRRLKYRPVGGFCLHCLIDAQPAISTAVIDHERNTKLAYDALAAACHPVVVVADPLPDELEPGERRHLVVHVVSDLRHPVVDAEVSAVVRSTTTEVRTAWRGDLPADDVVRVGELEVLAPARPGTLEVVLTVTAGAETSTTTDRCEVLSPS